MLGNWLQKGKQNKNGFSCKLDEKRKPFIMVCLIEMSRFEPCQCQSVVLLYKEFDSRVPSLSPVEQNGSHNGCGKTTCK